MEDYLLDTNILIYAFDKNPKVLECLSQLHKDYFFVSVISYFEFLTGAKDALEQGKIERRLKELAPLDVRVTTVMEANKLQKKYPKKLKFKDLLIAATAQVEGLTLVTADKDFQKIKGLKVKLVKV